MHRMSFMDTCKMQDFYMWLAYSGGLNWIPHLSVFWSKDGDLRHTHFIFPATSVQLHSRTLVYNSVCRLMGMLLQASY
ncbi:hypothetical protein Goarm_000422 [Gossypium armourianum]|uniref:Uncharacterized protein n=1 Tax=Gossypium armourianum TaxID=34283 RepID=A0A7J9K9Y4_9ROSI|nr:hypothetical protein [Gossypium armourianum]